MSYLMLKDPKFFNGESRGKIENSIIQICIARYILLFCSLLLLITNYLFYINVDLCLLHIIYYHIY